MPGAASTFGQFIALLEEGRLYIDLLSELRSVIVGLRDAAEASNGKVQATLNLKLDFVMESEVFLISAMSTTKFPDSKRARSRAWLRARSHAWATDDGRFSPNPPNQGALFGVRDVGARPYRNA